LKELWILWIVRSETWRYGKARKELKAIRTDPDKSDAAKALDLQNLYLNLWSLNN